MKKENNDFASDFEKAKQLFGSYDFEKLTAGLNKTIEKLPNVIQPLTDEIKKINDPKAKKNLKINGKNCFVSLIEDGRVMVTLPTFDDAKSFYDSLSNYDTKVSFWKKIFKKWQ